MQFPSIPGEPAWDTSCISEKPFVETGMTETSMTRALKPLTSFRSALPEPRERWSESDLRRYHGDYCAKQAAALVSLISREAIRPLYARAREWAASGGSHESKDPMRSLVRFCRTILPLPPYEVWLEDFHRNRMEYLRESMEVGMGTAPAEPLTVDVRSISLGDRPWNAGLALFQEGAKWRGYITFQESPGSRAARTADIFLDGDPEEIRNRFRSFRSATLEAFLRSALP